MENTSKEIPTEELICPITLELFRDPVRAKDGHCYEREAITKWILQHGTSPLTREPLQINDLQPDDRLRNLARARRTSAVSYKSYNEQVTLPPPRRLGRSSHRIAPADISSPREMNCPFRKRCCIILFIAVLFIVVTVVVTVTAVLLSRSSSQSQSTSTYSGALTSNSSTFRRLYDLNNGRYYYDRIGIRVSRGGVYQISSESAIDTYGYLYQNLFNSTNVYSNILTSDDDNGGRRQFYLQYSLVSNANYTLIVTTYGANVTGSYIIRVRGRSTVTFT